MDGSLFSPVVELRRTFEGLPGFLRTPIELVVFGGELPRADISGLRRLADELRARSAELDDHSADIATLLKQEDSVGELAENLRAALGSYRKDAARLGKDVDALADQAQGAANDAEKWLCVMFAFGIHLAWRIYGLIAAAAAGGPASQVAAAPAVQATLAEGRAEVAVMRANLHRAIQAGGAQAAARLSGLGPGQFAKWMGMAVALPVGVDAGVQALQVATGDRTPEIMGTDGSNPTGIDLTSIKVAALAGAGGAVGGMLAGRFAPMVFPQIATSRVAMGVVHGVAGGISGLGAASLVAGWPQHYEQVLGPMLNGAFAGGVYARSARPPAVDGAGAFTPPDAISPGRDGNAAAPRPPVEVSPESKRAWEAARQAWKSTAEAANSAQSAARPPAEGAPKAAAAQPQSRSGGPTAASADGAGARTARAADGRTPGSSGDRAPEGAGSRTPEGAGSRTPEGAGGRASGPQATAGAAASDPAAARPRPEPTATAERPPAEKQPAAGRASAPRSAEAAGETSPPPKIPASARPDGGVPDKAGLPAREHTAVADGAGNAAPARPHPVADGEAGSPRVHDGEQPTPQRNAGDEHGLDNPAGSHRTESAGDGADAAAAGEHVPPSDQGGRADGADASAGPARSARDRAIDLLADYHAASGADVPENQRLHNLPNDVVSAGLRSGDEHQSMLATVEIIRRGTVSEAVPDGMVLRVEQAEAVYMLASRPAEMKPGQGKSLVFMAAAIQRAVQHGDVLLVTTADALAHREAETYRKLLADFEIDVFRADQENGFGPITKGRPAIVVATGETVGHLANAGIKPPRHVLIDEIDAIIDRGERQFLRSEGPEQAAPDATARQVFDAHDFLVKAIANNKLSHEDFGLVRIAEEIGVHADGTAEIFYWYDGQPELTSAGRAKVEALPGGKDWLEGMGASRLETAAHAEFLVRRGVHYEMDAGKIVIIDQAEHGLQRNPKTSSESRWSAEPGKASLAQAIEAKEFRAATARGESPEQHRIMVRADAESAKRIDSVEIYRVGDESLFDEVTGASGTLTDLNPVLQKVYGLEPAHEIARSQPHRLVEGQHDVVESTHAKLRTIAEYANEMRDGGAGRFQEILVHRNDLVERQVEALVRAGVPREAIEAVDAKRIIGWGADWEAQLQKIFDEAGEQGKILVINRQGQRGVDISVSDAVKAKGGMHVWMTEAPEQSYIHEQAKNRTARNGQLGSAQVVMSSQDALIRNAMHLRGVREVVIHYEQAVAAHAAAPTPRTHDAVVAARRAVHELVPELQQRALRHATADFIRHHAFSTAIPTLTLAEADTGQYAGDVDFTRPDGPADRSARLAGLLGIPDAAIADHIAALERDGAFDPIHQLLQPAGIAPAAVEALRQHVDSTAPATTLQRALFTDEQAVNHAIPLRDRLAADLGLPITAVDGAEGMRTLHPVLTEARDALAAALGYPAAGITPDIAREILGEAVADHLRTANTAETTARDGRDTRDDAAAAAADSLSIDHDRPDATVAGTTVADATVTDATAVDAAVADAAVADATPQDAAAQKPGTQTSTVDHGAADDIVAAASRYLALSALLDSVVQIHRRSPTSCVNNAVTGMRVLCPDNADRFRVPSTRLGGYGLDDVHQILGARLDRRASLQEVVDSLESRPGGITVLVYKWKDTRANGTRIEADDHMVLLVNDSTSVDEPNLLVVDLAASRDRDTANDYGPKDLRNRRTLLNKAVGFDDWLRDQKERISLPAEQQRFETIEFDRDGNLVPRLRADAPEAEQLPPDQRVDVPAALQDDINAIPAGQPGLGETLLVRSGAPADTPNGPRRDEQIPADSIPHEGPGHRRIGSRPSHSAADPSRANSADALNRARGAWIAARRHDKSRRDGTTMTAADLARAVGVNRSTMSRIEQGSTRPRPGLFAKIGRALGVPRSEFLSAAADFYPDADFDPNPVAYSPDAPGRWLSAMLHDRDMSWEELAQASGTSAKYLSAVGRNESVPGAAVFLALCEALHVNGDVMRDAASRFYPGERFDTDPAAYSAGEQGLWLRSRRYLSRMAQQETAEAAGISTIHLRSIEAGERDPGVVVFLSLCDALAIESDVSGLAAAHFYPDTRFDLDWLTYAPGHQGLWFRALRYHYRLHRSDVADDTGLTEQYIGQIERGERTPSRRTFRLLGRELGISPIDLDAAEDHFSASARTDAPGLRFDDLTAGNEAQADLVERQIAESLDGRSDPADLDPEQAARATEDAATTTPAPRATPGPSPAYPAPADLLDTGRAVDRDLGARPHTPFSKGVPVEGPMAFHTAPDGEPGAGRARSEGFQPPETPPISSGDSTPAAHSSEHPIDPRAAGDTTAQSPARQPDEQPQEILYEDANTQPAADLGENVSGTIVFRNVDEGSDGSEIKLRGLVTDIRVDVPPVAAAADEASGAEGPTFIVELQAIESSVLSHPGMWRELGKPPSIAVEVDGETVHLTVLYRRFSSGAVEATTIYSLPAHDPAWLEALRGSVDTALTSRFPGSSIELKEFYEQDPARYTQRQLPVPAELAPADRGTSTAGQSATPVEVSVQPGQSSEIAQAHEAVRSTLAGTPLERQSAAAEELVDALLGLADGPAVVRATRGGQGDAQWVIVEMTDHSRSAPARDRPNPNTGIFIPSDTGRALTLLDEKSRTWGLTLYEDGERTLRFTLATPAVPDGPLHDRGDLVVDLNFAPEEIAPGTGRVRRSFRRLLENEHWPGAQVDEVVLTMSEFFGNVARYAAGGSASVQAWMRGSNPDELVVHISDTSRKVPDWKIPDGDEPEEIVDDLPLDQIDEAELERRLGVIDLDALIARDENPFDLTTAQVDGTHGLGASISMQGAASIGYELAPYGAAGKSIQLTFRMKPPEQTRTPSDDSSPTTPATTRTPSATPAAPDAMWTPADVLDVPRRRTDGGPKHPGVMVPPRSDAPGQVTAYNPTSDGSDHAHSSSPAESNAHDPAVAAMRRLLGPLATRFAFGPGARSVDFLDYDMLRADVETFVEQFAEIRPTFDEIGAADWHQQMLDYLRAKAEAAPVTRYVNRYGASDHADLTRLLEGISGEVDSSGVLSLRVVSSDRTPSGAEMFDDLWQAIGQDVRSISGAWKADAGQDSNLITFNAGIAGGLTPEEAALTTWTGKMAVRHGFGEVEVLHLVGPPGNHSQVVVAFTPSQVAVAADGAGTTSPVAQSDLPDADAESPSAGLNSNKPTNPAPTSGLPTVPPSRSDALDVPRRRTGSGPMHPGVMEPPSSGPGQVTAFDPRGDRRSHAHNSSLDPLVASLLEVLDEQRVRSARNGISLEFARSSIDASSADAAHRRLIEVRELLDEFLHHIRRPAEADPTRFRLLSHLFHAVEARHGATGAERQAIEQRIDRLHESLRNTSAAAQPAPALFYSKKGSTDWAARLQYGREIWGDVAKLLTAEEIEALRPFGDSARSESLQALQSALRGQRELTPELARTIEVLKHTLARRPSPEPMTVSIGLSFDELVVSETTTGSVLYLPEFKVATMGVLPPLLAAGVEVTLTVSPDTPMFPLFPLDDLPDDRLVLPSLLLTNGLWIRVDHKQDLGERQWRLEATQVPGPGTPSWNEPTTVPPPTVIVPALPPELRQPTTAVPDPGAQAGTQTGNPWAAVDVTPDPAPPSAPGHRTEPAVQGGNNAPPTGRIVRHEPENSPGISGWDPNSVAGMVSRAEFDSDTNSLVLHAFERGGISHALLRGETRSPFWVDIEHAGLSVPVRVIYRFEDGERYDAWVFYQNPQIDHPGFEPIRKMIETALLARFPDRRILLREEFAGTDAEPIDRVIGGPPAVADEQPGDAPPAPADHAERAAGPIAAVSDIGVGPERKGRSNNEDAFDFTTVHLEGQAPVHLATVADGVGGSPLGGEAALAAVRAAVAGMAEASTQLASAGEFAPIRVVRRGMSAARAAVAELAETPGQPNSPDAAIALAVVHEDKLVVDWAGDTRVYWLPMDGGQAKQLNVDDTIVPRLVADNVPEGEALAMSISGQLTRSLGRPLPEDATSHATEFTLEGRGYVLIATDGIWHDTYQADALATIIRQVHEQSPGDHRAVAEALNEHAHTTGTRDNMTDLVIWVDTTTTQPAQPPADPRQGFMNTDDKSANPGRTGTGGSSRTPGPTVSFQGTDDPLTRERSTRKRHLEIPGALGLDPSVLNHHHPGGREWGDPALDHHSPKAGPGNAAPATPASLPATEGTEPIQAPFPTSSDPSRSSVIAGIRRALTWFEEDNALMSPLSAENEAHRRQEMYLLRALAADAAAGGIVAELLSPHSPPGGKASSHPVFRLIQAVHHRALSGLEPDVARWHTVMGGQPAHTEADLRTMAQDVLQTIRDHAAELAPFLLRGTQINDPARARLLLPVEILAAVATGLPVRVLSVGACGMLDARAHLYRYRFADAEYGNPDAATVIDDRWTARPDQVDRIRNLLDVRPQVIEVAGADLDPLQADNIEDQRRLAAGFVGTDNDAVRRIQTSFIDAQRAGDMPIDQESALTWLPRRLAQDRTGSATIVWDSMLRRYLTPEQNAELDTVIAQAGAAATARDPLIYAKYEIIDGAEALTVRMYTGSDTREFVLPTQLPNRSPGIDLGDFFTAVGLLPAEEAPTATPVAETTPPARTEGKATQLAPVETLRLDDERRTHILDGDATGGGHRAGTGKPGKTEFPPSWDDDQIIDLVWAIARSWTNATLREFTDGRTGATHFWQLEHTHEGVHVVVRVALDGRILTAWPARGPGVVRNPSRTAPTASPPSKVGFKSETAARVLITRGPESKAPGFAKFPADWAGDVATFRRIVAEAGARALQNNAIVDHPERPGRRWLLSAEHEGVEFFIEVDGRGRVHYTWPETGPGVTYNPPQSDSGQVIASAPVDETTASVAPVDQPGPQVPRSSAEFLDVPTETTPRTQVQRVVREDGTAPGQLGEEGERVRPVRPTREWAVEVLRNRFPWFSKIDEAEYGIDEYVANALRHTNGEVILTITETHPGNRRALRFTVSDNSTDIPQPGDLLDFEATRGRGLAIVQAAADDTGVTVHHNGKHMWFEFHTPLGAAQAAGPDDPAPTASVPDETSAAPSRAREQLTPYEIADAFERKHPGTSMNLPSALSSEQAHTFAQIFHRLLTDFPIPLGVIGVSVVDGNGWSAVAKPAVSGDQVSAGTVRFTIGSKRLSELSSSDIASVAIRVFGQALIHQGRWRAESYLLDELRMHYIGGGGTGGERGFAAWMREQFDESTFRGDGGLWQRLALSRSFEKIFTKASDATEGHRTLYRTLVELAMGQYHRSPSAYIRTLAAQMIRPLRKSAIDAIEELRVVDRTSGLDLDDIDPEVVHTMLRQFAPYFATFDKLRLATLSVVPMADEDVMGCVFLEGHEITLQISERYAINAELHRQTVADGAASGHFSAPGVDGAAETITHEMGHVLQFFAANVLAPDNVADAVANDWKAVLPELVKHFVGSNLPEDLGEFLAHLQRELSGYSVDQDGKPVPVEAFAEAHSAWRWGTANQTELILAAHLVQRAMQANERLRAPRTQQAAQEESGRDASGLAGPFPAPSLDRPFPAEQAFADMLSAAETDPNTRFTAEIRAHDTQPPDQQGRIVPGDHSAESTAQPRADATDSDRPFEYRPSMSDEEFDALPTYRQHEVALAELSGTALMFGSRDEAIDYARQHFTTTFSEPVRESFAWIRGSVT
ncbi:DUF2332 family protein, partial [Nocardia cyriacigeorgica]